MSTTLSEINALKQRLAVLEAQAIEEAKNPQIRRPAAGHSWFSIYQDKTGDFKTTAQSHSPAFSRKPVFGDYTQAQRFSEAIQVILEMRCQPGIIAPQPHEDSYVITPQRDNSIKYIKSKCTDAVPSTIYSRYRSLEAARAAVAAVGEARVVQAARTLAFFQ